MSDDKVGVRGAPKDVTTGKLSKSDKGSHSQKGDSKARRLGIGHLDRTHGYSHNHYSWKDVAAANNAVEGQSHE